MTPPRQAPVTGVVFRRLRSPSERAAADRLLAEGDASGSPVEGAGGDVLFGLWDLAGLDAEALLAAAATRPVDAGGSVELRGIVVRARLRRRRLGRRLLAEVADALRSEGAARLVARLTGGRARRRRC